MLPSIWGGVKITGRDLGRVLQSFPKQRLYKQISLTVLKSFATIPMKQSPPPAESNRCYLTNVIQCSERTTYAQRSDPITTFDRDLPRRSSYVRRTRLEHDQENLPLNKI